MFTQAGSACFCRQSCHTRQSDKMTKYLIERVCVLIIPQKTIFIGVYCDVVHPSVTF